MKPQSASPATEESLCKELEAYCIWHALPLKSADEIIQIDGLPAEHREWLQGYITRWDALMESQTVRIVELKTPLELAGCFISALRDALPRDEFASCLNGQTDPDSVCDSNMVMAEAFKRLHERETWLPSDLEDKRCTEAQHSADLALWNAAVAIVNQHLRATATA